jgi:hypothetical protein
MEGPHTYAAGTFRRYLSEVNALVPAGGRDSPNQAILQFEALLNNQNISLTATAACLHAHKRCRLVDQEAVEMLTMNVDSKQRCARAGAALGLGVGSG